MTPDVFTFRRSTYSVLSKGYLSDRLADAKTWGDFRALVNLMELGSIFEKERGNLKHSTYLRRSARVARGVMEQRFRRLAFDSHTTD